MELVLTTKAAKLMRLCEIEGYGNAYDLLQAAAGGGACPAICMTEGCEYTTQTTPNESQGHCKSCGGSTVTSALVLGGLSAGGGHETASRRRSDTL
jgi:hypothetical protein